MLHRCNISCIEIIDFPWLFGLLLLSAQMQPLTQDKLMSYVSSWETSLEAFKVHLALSRWRAIHICQCLCKAPHAEVSCSPLRHCSRPDAWLWHYAVAQCKLACLWSLTVISSDIPSGTLSGISSRKHSDILSGNSSDILTGISVASFLAC